ncbi:hypothetical protein FJZ31_43625 [Candidatus Poribacteria bacterium]|nr:hypothetical protein [Candidatus Poribacteria bacterium]
MEAQAMKGEEAVEIFKLVKTTGNLPQKLDDLVPLSFIGQAAVSFYRQKIKLMDQLKITEAQRKATLRDGQDAGEMLLDIETRIGELAEKEQRATTPLRRDERGRVAGHEPSGRPPKHERLGIPENRMRQSQAIAQHPDIVEKVKTQARENEDIPTRTAVINEIRYQKEKKRREEAEKGKKSLTAMISIEEKLYISALEKCISILPIHPPKNFSDTGFKQANALVQILQKRMEVFNG